MRHTTFRFALDPISAQAAMLTRHAGASALPTTSACGWSLTPFGPRPPIRRWPCPGRGSIWLMASTPGSAVRRPDAPSLSPQAAPSSRRSPASHGGRRSQRRCSWKPPSTSAVPWQPTRRAETASVKADGLAFRGANARAAAARASGSV